MLEFVNEQLSACFYNRNYTVFQGKSNEGYEICVLIDRNGLIHVSAFGDEYIDTIENNGLLYVANPEFEVGGQGIYDAKTMEVVKEISISKLDNYKNILILTDNEGYKQVINRKTNKFIVDEYIDDFIYHSGRLVCFIDNQISVINADTCEFEIYWSNIISIIGEREKLLYLIQNKEGMFVVSKQFGLLTNFPIDNTFEVQPAKGVPNECKYLIMSQTYGIALNQDKVYFSQVSLNDFKKVQELTTLTPMDIREIFKEIITYFD